MADGRRNNKGTKGNNGGRPSKADEQKLIEKLSPLEPIAHKALKNALNEEEGWAIKLYFEYMYGKPKQTIDQNNTHTLSNFNLKDVLDFDKTE